MVPSPLLPLPAEATIPWDSGEIGELLQTWTRPDFGFRVEDGQQSVRFLVMYNNGSQQLGQVSTSDI